MIYGYTYQGSGIGNQLHRYVATRIVAQRHGTDWRMVYVPDGSGKKEGFKADFITFDTGKLVGEVPKGVKVYQEKKVTENGVDIRPFDPEFNFIEDNAIIDGELQDERYWEAHEKDVNEWLKVEALEMPDNLCVIGFRGGEFSLYPDLFLTKEYWDKALRAILEVDPHVRFEVHTDDPDMAKQFFPGFPVTSNPDANWRSMRYAKYAIIANSSFFIFPRWLNKGLTIAPRYWARRNTKIWALPQNFYKRFTYL